MYKEIVDPNFTWKNFSSEEQAKILAADRSNNCLDTTKLEEMYPNVKHIKDAVRDILTRINSKKEEEKRKREEEKRNKKQEKKSREKKVKKRKKNKKNKENNL